MNASIGAYEVLDSGTIVILGDEDITIKLGADPLVFKFKFQQKDGESAHINFNASGLTQLDITLINFDSPTGASNSETLQVGRLGEKGQLERALHLNFALTAFGTNIKTRIMHYTFMLGAVVGPLTN